MDKKPDVLPENWLTPRAKTFYYIIAFFYLWTFFMWANGEHSLGFYLFALPMTAWKLWDWTKAIAKWAMHNPRSQDEHLKIQG